MEQLSEIINGIIDENLILYNKSVIPTSTLTDIIYNKHQLEIKLYILHVFQINYPLIMKALKCKDKNIENNLIHIKNYISNECKKIIEETLNEMQYLK